MSLRQTIADKIRNNISVTLHGGEWPDHEIDNYDELADLILAIPEIRDALAAYAFDNGFRWPERFKADAQKEAR